MGSGEACSIDCDRKSLLKFETKISILLTFDWRSSVLGPHDRRITIAAVLHSQRNLSATPTYYGGPANDPLPEYKPGFSRAEWRKYHISTPTLSLTPVEKPDTSPYLVHITGEAEIASILRGKEGVSPAPADPGFFRASIPSQSKGNYFASVFCFTESPSRSGAQWRRSSQP